MDIARAIPNPLFHAARKLGRVQLISTFKVNPFQAKIGSVELFRLGHIGKQIEREYNIFLNGH